MDDTRCRLFFHAPAQTLHRRYEILRAFFVEGLSYDAIGERFTVPYHTVRSLVRDFRTQCRTDQVSPFLPSHAGDALNQTARRSSVHVRKFPRPPTAAA